jgi:hypothetical protein
LAPASASTQPDVELPINVALTKGPTVPIRVNIADGTADRTPDWWALRAFAISGGFARTSES